MKLLITCLFSSFLFSQTLYAGSLYGHFGIGERQYAVSARSLGMGGVNLALSDEFTLSRWNPAQWSNISPVRINLRSITSYNSVTDGGSSTFSDFNGFSMGIPIGSKFVVGGGINPITTSEYALSQYGSTNGEPWNLTITGSGGVSSFGVGVAYSINESFAVGVKYDWLFGRKEEEWITRFDNSALLGSKFLKSTSFDGSLFTIGFFSNQKNFNYAGSITLPINFSMIKEFSYQTIDPKSLPDKEDKEIDYPTEIRLGFTYDFGERYNYGLDYQRSDWSSFGLDFNGKFGTAYDIFGGIERKVSPKGESLVARVALRGGFTLRRLYAAGLKETAVSERAVTFGIGIPAHGGKELIDLGFSYGLRRGESSSTPEETTFLFMLGFSAGEKWFIRRPR